MQPLNSLAQPMGGYEALGSAPQFTENQSNVNVATAIPGVAMMLVTPKMKSIAAFEKHQEKI